MVIETMDFNVTTTQWKDEFVLCTKRGQFGGLPLQPLLPGKTLPASLALALVVRGQKAILANQATSFVTSVADWREGIGPADRDQAEFRKRDGTHCTVGL